MPNELAALTEEEIGPRAVADVAFRRAASEVYGLPDDFEARDLGGPYNLNLRVHRDGGDIVVRVHRPWVTRARLLMLHGTRKSLLREGFPVPEPWATVSGNTAWRIGDRWVEAEPFIPGDGAVDSWERGGAAFTLLARLHEALLEHRDDIAFLPPRVSSYALPTSLIPWLDRTAQAIRCVETGDYAGWEREGMEAQEAASSGWDARYALDVCERSRAMLLRLRSWWEDSGNRLPRQPVHGDFTGANLLFRDGEIAGLLNFDFLAVRERIFDLAYALYGIMARIEDDRPPSELPWSRAAAMLGRYNAETVRPLTLEEMRALPYEIARVPLYWVAEAWFTQDPLGTVAAREGSVRFAQWVMDNAWDLSAALRSSV